MPIKLDKSNAGQIRPTFEHVYQLLITFYVEPETLSRHELKKQLEYIIKQTKK